VAGRQGRPASAQVSSIKAGVTKGFEALGLTVEADRAGLTVSDGLDGDKMVVRIDENERVIRVERAICYPVDDFSPDLSRAMDFLNQQRTGVCFAYDESQRALLVSTVWTSPSRDPSTNQLQLLIGLVMEAAGRDGPALERVAEGELTVEDLRQNGGAPEDRQAALTTRFADRAASDSGPVDGEWSDTGDQATRAMPAGDSRMTTKFMSHADGEEGERRDPAPPPEVTKKSGMTRRFEELDQFAARSSPAEDETVHEPPPAKRPGRGGASDEQPPAQELTPKRGMSRSALQMAVYRQEHDKHEAVDMTAGRRSLGFRLVRGLFVLALVGGAGYGAWVYFIGPFFGGKDPLTVVRGWFKSSAPVDQIDNRIPVREQLQGKELLLAELEDPLEGELHEAYINRALSAVPDKTAALLEVIAEHKMPDVRQRAYALWTQAGLNDDDATRMRLLRALIEKGRAEERGERITNEVVSSLKLRAPSDEALIESLAWVKGPPWAAVVELLGRGGSEPSQAKKRSDALATQLPKDTEDFQVLRAMVKTGFAPADAAARLVQGRGLEWARGAEGKAQLTSFITESPDSITPLLRHEDEEFRLLAVELLIASAQPAAVDRLAKVALRDASLRVRLKTAIGLGSLGNADAAWPLALALARRDPPPEEAFVAEVKSALARLPIDQCVARLREHLAPTLQMSERYYAVGALGAVANAGGLPAIFDALRDPDPQVRRKALQVCEELQQQGHKIDGGLAQYRSLAREDADQNVRTTAARIYKAVTGRDP
jgi:HEAT repeat protein